MLLVPGPCRWAPKAGEVVSPSGLSGGIPLAPPVGSSSPHEHEPAPCPPISPAPPRLCTPRLRAPPA
eukprot:3322170-Prymnesium_polylepis.1